MVGENGKAVNLDQFEGHLDPDSRLSEAFYIQGHMDEAAGNEYQGKTLEGIRINVVATQDTKENDSYGNEYDKNATYPVTMDQKELNDTLTLDTLKDANGNISPVEVPMGDTDATDISYSENNTGYTGKGVLLGNTNLNKYSARPAATGAYKFTFKDGTINSAATGYASIDGCTFTAYTNAVSANNSNPIWWREDTEGSGANANPIKTFTFVNNSVTGTRPVKIERIGKSGFHDQEQSF